jgi:hypothetical protein
MGSFFDGNELESKSQEVGKLSESGNFNKRFELGKYLVNGLDPPGSLIDGKEPLIGILFQGDLI